LAGERWYIEWMCKHSTLKKPVGPNQSETPMTIIQQITALLDSCTPEQRREIFQSLRSEFPIHPIERDLSASAEVILEAISRSSDLIQRGIRGVIAEAAFETNVLRALKDWSQIPLVGDHSYDFLLRDPLGDVRIQVKMQRLKDHKPMRANQGYKRLPSNMYVVETQRTRGGRDTSTGEDTRPYRFGEFDILAVSLHPSTGDWNRFRYTVSNWLLPREDNPALILKFQPVPMQPNDTWADDLETCIRWFRSDK
jgi:hypothetical protein